jgi:class 3 adenylate cyclase
MTTDEQPGAVHLPTGTVTFVFTDVEGSTRLLKQLGDAEYATLLAVHRRLVRDIFAAHDGAEIDTQGDAFFYSFVRARQAVAAAVEVQRAHVKASWPADVEVRVRLGLHTGEPAVGDEGYTGLDVVRASRIAATGAGGQVLLSDTTRAIVAGGLPDGVTIRELGERQLKDIDRPEPIFELLIDDVPVTEEGSPLVAEARAAAPDEPSGRRHDSADDESPVMRDFVERARERIESRVVAQLDRVLAHGFPFGSSAPDLPAPPPRPAREQPDRPPGWVTTQIARLNELRKDGALTDEHYQRAVDRLLNEGP